MTYYVKEIYYTLQGEGANSGRPAVFCRFSGCNLWSGREQDRPIAVCNFCDTDFVGTDGAGGGIFSHCESLASAIASHWPSLSSSIARRFVVFTGGEPLLQLDGVLIQALHKIGFSVAVETNGTCTPPEGIDWLCVSPKGGTELVVRAGQELKLIYPQSALKPGDFIRLNFDHFFLQPMAGPHLKANTQSAVDYCLAHPTWRLSLQMHKVVGIP
jgi:7-carboxy-7-deazaguanine synthase